MWLEISSGLAAPTIDFLLRDTNRMTLYLVTFDLHDAPQPPGNVYSGIYKDISDRFGSEYFCKDFGQFCLVRTEHGVQEVKNAVKVIIDKKSNQFSSMDLVVFSLGGEISISRGRRDEDLKEFRKFFLAVEQR